MFTGIISCKAQIKQAPQTGQAGKVVIAVAGDFLSKVKLGDSIAVDGVCLTVIRFEQNSFTVEISQETVSKTNFDKLNINRIVNLEHAMKLGDSLDGHLVQGHVDTVAKIINITTIENNKKVVVELLDSSYTKYIAEKGSITLNGVSLTVNQVCNDKFSVNLIPYTLSATNLDDLKIGDRVNLEIDMFARYCVNYLEALERTKNKKKLQNVVTEG